MPGSVKTGGGLARNELSVRGFLSGNGVAGREAWNLIL
jgi:hypothetical protein